MSRHLKIIHCLRAPIGGLFRHVLDLALEQSLVGHEVGVVFDRSFEAQINPDHFRLLKTHCKLGVRTVPMSRLLHFNDFLATRRILHFARETGAQILHGHGAKGGAYARLAATRLRGRGHPVLSFYTPHGGSLHYDPSSFSGRLFLGLEKKLAPKTNGLIFESQYSADIYQQRVGGGFCPVRVIPNGLAAHEFKANQPVDGGSDFLFVGELRRLKGVDVLLTAFRQLLDKHPSARLSIVGDGPDMGDLIKQAQRLELEANVTFHGRLPARKAFPLGRVMVVPSRAESFPYIVLEAGAAQMPLIATDVGGIGEIVAGSPVALIKADDVAALHERLEDVLTKMPLYQAEAQQLATVIANKFTIEKMAAQITDFYLAVLKR